MRVRDAILTVTFLVFLTSGVFGGNAQKRLRKIYDHIEGQDPVSVRYSETISEGKESRKRQLHFQLLPENHAFRVTVNRADNPVKKVIGNGSFIRVETFQNGKQETVEQYRQTDFLYNLFIHRFHPASVTGFFSLHQSRFLNPDQYQWEIVEEEGKTEITGHSNADSVRAKLVLKGPFSAGVPETRSIQVTPENQSGSAFSLTRTVQEYHASANLSEKTFSISGSEIQLSSGSMKHFLGTEIGAFQYKKVGEEEYYSNSGMGEAPLVLYDWGDHVLAPVEVAELRELKSTFPEMMLLSITEASKGKVKRKNRVLNIPDPVVGTNNAPDVLKEAATHPVMVLVDEEGTIQQILEGQKSKETYQFAFRLHTGRRPLTLAKPEVTKAKTARNLADAVNKKISSFSMKEYGSSKKHRLKDYQGKVLFINVWRTWCPPCREELPHLAELHRKYADQFAVLAVTDERPVEVTRFLDTVDLPFPALNERTGSSPGILDLVHSYPVTIVVDREGIVREVIRGAKSREQFEKKLVSILEE